MLTQPNLLWLWLCPVVRFPVCPPPSKLLGHFHLGIGRGNEMQQRHLVFRGESQLRRIQKL